MGDKVLSNVAPNRYGLKLGKSRKLSPRFCGPFEIVKRIRQAYYELKLPKDWKIHNVFHVGLLRKYVFDSDHIFFDLPKPIPEGELFAKLKKILKMENQYLRNKSFCRFYMKWKDFHEQDVSWEK